MCVCDVYQCVCMCLLACDGIFYVCIIVRLHKQISIQETHSVLSGSRFFFLVFFLFHNFIFPIKFSLSFSIEQFVSFSHLLYTYIYILYCINKWLCDCVLYTQDEFSNWNFCLDRIVVLKNQSHNEMNSTKIKISNNNNSSGGDDDDGDGYRK